MDPCQRAVPLPPPGPLSFSAVIYRAALRLLDKTFSTGPKNSVFVSRFLQRHELYGDLVVPRIRETYGRTPAA